MQQFCQVNQCRHPESHVTQGHRCGKCFNYGHGKTECKDSKLQAALKNKNEKLPKELYCKHNCKYKKLHTTAGHHCFVCGGNHTAKDCDDLDDGKVHLVNKDLHKDEKFEIMLYSNMKLINKIPGKIYIVVPGGQGHMVMIRRNGLGRRARGFFMHSDSWGQYGKETSDQPQMKKFLNGYVKVELPSGGNPFD